MFPHGIAFLLPPGDFLFALCLLISTTSLRDPVWSFSTFPLSQDILATSACKLRNLASPSRGSTSLPTFNLFYRRQQLLSHWQNQLQLSTKKQLIMKEQETARERKRWRWPWRNLNLCGKTLAEWGSEGLFVYHPQSNHNLKLLWVWETCTSSV